MRFLGLLLLGLSCAGCRTLHSDREDFTRESAIAELKGYYPAILKYDEHSITVTDWAERGNPIQIRFADIESVRLVPRAGFIVLWPFTLGIAGPLWHYIEIETTDGRQIEVLRACRPGLNLFWLWLYPNVLIHGHELGFALDWLRQFADEPVSNTPPRK